MTDVSFEFSPSPAYDKAVRVGGELAESIRQSSLEQVEYWRQLPLLALLNWGNHGAYQAADATLFEKGLLSVNGTDSDHRLLGTYVDCATGEILWVPDKFEDRRTANDTLVIGAWLTHNPHGGFDARQILKRYQAAAANQRPPDKVDLEVHLQSLTPQRLALAEALGLRAVYHPDPSLHGAELDEQTYQLITAVGSYLGPIE